MLRIVKGTDPVSVNQLVVTIYAAPGFGKTSLGYTAESPLLIDFDGGSYRAANRKDSVPVANWKEVTEIAADDLKPYKTLVVDTAGRALDYLTADIITTDPKKGNGGALSLQGFGVLKGRFSQWLKMVRLLGLDVVLVAHMDEQKKGDDIAERLDITGGSKNEIYKSSDAMGRIVIQNKKYFIDFTPRENSFGKNPCSLELIEFPKPTMESRTLADVISTIKTRLNQLSAEQVKAEREIEEWTAFFDEFSTAQQFNDYMDELRDASILVKGLAMKRAKSVGLSYNKANGGAWEVSHVA